MRTTTLSLIITIVILTLSMQACTPIKAILYHDELCKYAFDACSLFQQIYRHTTEQDTCRHYTPEQLQALQNLILQNPELFIEQQPNQKAIPYKQ